MPAVADLPRVTIGNRARITLEIDIDETPTDPTTLTLIVRGDRETLGPYEFGVGAVIVKDAVGRYHADVIPTRTGRFRWRYDARAASDVPLAATEGEFWIVSVLEGS